MPGRAAVAERSGISVVGEPLQPSYEVRPPCYEASRYCSKRDLLIDLLKASLPDICFESSKD
jgi:hypothetical protein